MKSTELWSGLEKPLLVKGFGCVRGQNWTSLTYKNPPHSHFPLQDTVHIIYHDVWNRIRNIKTKINTHLKMSGSAQCQHERMNPEVSPQGTKQQCWWSSLSTHMFYVNTELPQVAGVCLSTCVLSVRPDRRDIQHQLTPAPLPSEEDLFSLLCLLSKPETYGLGVRPASLIVLIIDPTALEPLSAIWV